MENDHNMLLGVTGLSDGGFARSCVSFVRRFSRREMSSKVLSTVFLRSVANSGIRSLSRPVNGKRLM